MPGLGLALRTREQGGLGGGATPTNCMLLTQHPTNANVIGYSSDFLNGGSEAYGTMIPNTTADGTFIYSYEIDHSNGLFTLRFGEDAVTQIPNVTDAVLYHNADGADGDILFVWDDINKWYSATDLEKATNIKAYLGEVVCLSATAIPRVLIWYDFETMVVAGQEDYVASQSFKLYTTINTPNPMVGTFKSPIGTSFTIHGVVYNGNNDVDVDFSIPWTSEGEEIVFQENMTGCVTFFTISSQNLTGDIPRFRANADMTLFTVSGNDLTGVVHDLQNLPNIQAYSVGNNSNITGVSGDLSLTPDLWYLSYASTGMTMTELPAISANLGMRKFYGSNLPSIAGNIPDLTVNTELEVYSVHSNPGLIGFDGGTITINTGSYGLNISDCSLTESAVDDLLRACVDGNTTGAVTIRLETGNAPPSAAGEANIDILRGRGCIVTVEGGY